MINDTRVKQGQQVNYGSGGKGVITKCKQICQYEFIVVGVFARVGQIQAILPSMLCITSWISVHMYLMTVSP